MLFVKFLCTIVITLFISGMQKYLSTRKSWLLGAIIPILTAGILTTMFYINKVPFSFESLVPCAILIVLELFIWIDGRFQHKRMEIRKMKAKDIG